MHEARWCLLEMSTLGWVGRMMPPASRSCPTHRLTKIPAQLAEHFWYDGLFGNQQDRVERAIDDGRRGLRRMPRRHRRVGNASLGHIDIHRDHIGRLHLVAVFVQRPKLAGGCGWVHWFRQLDDFVTTKPRSFFSQYP